MPRIAGPMVIWVLLKLLQFILPFNISLLIRILGYKWAMVHDAERSVFGSTLGGVLNFAESLTLVLIVISLICVLTPAWIGIQIVAQKSLKLFKFIFLNMTHTDIGILFCSSFIFSYTDLSHGSPMLAQSQNLKNWTVVMCHYAIFFLTYVLVQKV